MTGELDGVAAFYDGFASNYHLAYGGAWENAVKRQGAALDELIGRVLPGAVTVLDCACGIGTQAIGLALRGYRVRGSDLSTAAIERATLEGQRLGAEVELSVADFRDLSSIEGTFDVVLCCDNAIPHLLTESDLLLALASMTERLRPDGLLVITMRDFDIAIAERPVAGPAVVVPGPPRQVLLRLHDWDPVQPIYDVTYLVLTEEEIGWSVEQHLTRYRALTRAELAHAAAQTELERLDWPKDVIVGNQQVATLRRAASLNS